MAVFPEFRVNRHLMAVASYRTKFMWWFVATLVIAAIFTSQTPKTQTQKPAGLNEVNVPTAEEGREIPVLFGQRDLQGANVVWYGHLKTTAIKKSGGKK